MREPIIYLAVRAIAPRSDRAFRSIHHARNFVVRQTLDVLQQDWQAKLRVQLRNRLLHRFSDFEPRKSLFLWCLFAVVRHGHSLTPRQPTLAPPSFVETRVDHEPV